MKYFTQIAILCCCLCLLPSGSIAQKKALTPDAYPEWKRITSPDMSEDGLWIIYQITPPDTPLLYLHNTRTRKTRTIPGAENAFFCGKGKWLCYRVQDSTLLLHLPDGRKTEWDKAEPFQALEHTGWAYREHEVRPDSGTTFRRLILYNMEDRDSLIFDHITCYHFYDRNRSILYVQEKAGESTICYGTLQGKQHKLCTYPSDSLQNLRFSPASRQGYFSAAGDSAIYAFSLPERQCRLILRKKDIPVPAGSRIRNLRLSESHEYATYELYPHKTPLVRQPQPAPGFDLQLWTWNEEIPQSRQEKLRPVDRMEYPGFVFNLKTRTSFEFDSTGKRQLIVPSCKNHTHFITLDKGPYLRYADRRENPGFDAYLVDIANGSSRLIIQNLTEIPVWSPDGRYALFYNNEQRSWYKLDITTRQFTNLSASIGYPVYDEKHDRPGPARPYGIAGWSGDGKQVALYDRYDIWMIDLTDTRKACSFTRNYGRNNQKVIRMLKVNFTPESFHPEKENLVEVVDETTKQEGIYLLDASGKLKKQWEGPFAFRILKFSADRKYALFEKQSYTEFRNLWWATTDFKHPLQITDANPQQKNYNWGSVQLIKWKNGEGKANEGLLYLPENYDPSRKYPVLVQFYETHSQDLFVYHTPALSAALADIPTLVSNGYIVFMPDVHFTIGRPGESCYNAVVSGVEMLIDRNMAQPGRIGLQGHSWSGFQCAWLVTHTDIFTCAAIGAPVTDMPGGYVGIRKGSGLPRFLMYEDTQCRMKETLWENKEGYLANSALLYADRVTTPLLIFHNDADEAVSYEQGLGLFMAMRRLGKTAWLLNYKGEGHFLSNPVAQRDWTIRSQQFFDYYLKNNPSPKWMEEGLKSFPVH